jgi:hypothetical protein
MVERKTAQGRVLDMEALMAEQPETIAAGNAGTNARGDKLGPGGKIIETVQEAAAAYYENNPKAVKTQSIKDDLPSVQADNMQPTEAGLDVPQMQKQEFDEWVDPEDTVETPTGKVTTEEDRVIASGDAKKQKKEKSKETLNKAKKSIDDLYT